MEVKKYHMGDGHLMGHVDPINREGKEPPKGVTPNMSNIDPTRSHLDFNLSPNNRRMKEQLQYIKDVTGKTVRKNAVVFFSTWVTMPKQYQTFDSDVEFAHHFFQDIYDTLLLFYGLEEEDVVSAWVHMDETRPHIHLFATPIYREEGKDPICYFDRVLPKRKFWKLHPFTEDMMKAKGWEDIHLMTGHTRDGNWAVKDLKRNGALEKLKELEQDLSKRQEELSALQQDASQQSLLLERFRKEEKEKEERLRQLAQQADEKQEELNRINQTLLQKRTDAYQMEKQSDHDAELILRHKADVKRLLLAHPNLLTKEEWNQLEGKNYGISHIHDQGTRTRGHLL